MYVLGELNIYYQNVRGLRTKTHAFLSSVLNADYDVICLTETWLLPSIFDSELFDERYVVYRCDRNYVLLGQALGGGSLIAVRRELPACPSPSLPPFQRAEIASATLALGSGARAHKLRIYCSYFVQGAEQIKSLSDFFEFISTLSTNFPNDEFLLLGDFNIPHASWLPPLSTNGALILSKSSIDALTSTLSDFLDFTGFCQFNNQLNVNERVLDLVITSCACTVSGCDTPLVPEDAHHRSLNVALRVLREPSLQIPRSRTVRSYHSADYAQINSVLAAVDWTTTLNSSNVDSVTARFYSELNKVIVTHIPSRRVNIDSRFPPWYNSALKKVIKDKLKFHKKYKIYNHNSDYQTFSLLRDRQKCMEKECYDNFINRAEININTNPKHFWTFVKSKQKSSELPNNMFLSSQQVSGGEAISNLFNIHFQSSFESRSPCTSSTTRTHSPNTSVLNLNNVNIDTELVRKYLKSLDPTKGSGPDGIHPVFLKNCASVLCYPLSQIFKTSLSSGIFPQQWKSSYVVPIFKKGDKHNIENYRPISKLNVMGKLFEKIVFDIIFPCIRPHIISNQHGFVTKKSTETNLCEFVDTVLVAMDKGYQVDVVYTDYSKAFDKIPHSILIEKVEAMGIHGDLLRWLTSYLENRTQAVTVQGFCSSFVPVTSGVPQGSHLGPLLFNIFMNDVNKTIRNSQLYLYADDKKIVKIIKSETDCIELQDDLDSLINVYCLKNRLLLNADKCSVISYSRKKNTILYPYIIKNKLLKRVSEIRDLGVLLDSKLLFQSHVEHITSKALKMLGFILRVSSVFKNPQTFKILYISYVRSHLEYASTVWNPHCSTYKLNIERVQNKFLKYVSYRMRNDGNYVSMNLKTLDERRDIRDLVMLYKIIHNFIDSPYLLQNINFRCPLRVTRSPDTFYIPKSNTNYLENVFIRRSCSTFNRLCTEIDVFNTKLTKFKTFLKK